MTTRELDWSRVAHAFAERAHAARYLWGFTDVNEKGEHDRPGARVAIAFYDKRPFADGRRETMHGALRVLLEEHGTRELARATFGDAAVILFEGTCCAAVADLRDRVTAILNDYAAVPLEAN